MGLQRLITCGSLKPLTYNLKTCVERSDSNSVNQRLKYAQAMFSTQLFASPNIYKLTFETLGFIATIVRV